MKVITFGVKTYEFDPSLAARMVSPPVESIRLLNVAGELLVIWPRGGSREGTLAGHCKPLMYVANRGAGGIFQALVVHL